MLVPLNYKQKISTFEYYMLKHCQYQVCDIVAMIRPRRYQEYAGDSALQHIYGRIQCEFSDSTYPHYHRPRMV